ncbi:MAG: ribonuclease BN [Nitrospirae bacterium GWD2_57_9]|nr:MAG: ribonuclease BN [Nitrospirae bacterium GWD2_57_9]
MLRPKQLYELLKEAASQWSNDKSLKLGAALSYYTVFSLPPLLLIVIATAAFAFDEEAARGQIVAQFQGFIGKENAAFIETMIEQKAAAPERGLVATAIGLIVLLLGASGVFGELQDSLNTVWNVKPKPGAGLRHMIRTRLLSFSLILTIGFLLLVSLVLSAALAAFGAYLNRLWPGPPVINYLLQAGNVLLSFALITALFAMLFKILPDARIAWRDVWLGASVTAVLFTAGKFLLGLYLGTSDVASAYGAAGSLIILLLWIYYSSQILFFGAEFTRAYANRYGSRITPAAYAEPISEGGSKKAA